MPTIDHRSPMFGEILRPCLAGVRRVLDSASVFIFPSIGTGGWKTALTNPPSRGDRVLAVRHGMFSHRWIEMCRRLGLEAEENPDLWSDTVSAIRTSESFDATRIVNHAAGAYGMAFGVGIGEVAGKGLPRRPSGQPDGRDDALGSRTAEMVMADPGLPIQLGSGVAAAQEVYRVGRSGVKQAAA